MGRIVIKVYFSENGEQNKRNGSANPAHNHGITYNHWFHYFRNVYPDNRTKCKCEIDNVYKAKDDYESLSIGMVVLNIKSSRNEGESSQRNNQPDC